MRLGCAAAAAAGVPSAERNVVWQEFGVAEMWCARGDSGAELGVRLASWSRVPGLRSGGASDSSAMGPAAEAAETSGPGLRGPA